MWLLLTLLLADHLVFGTTTTTTAVEPQPGYGYVGPACAVVDGTLFLHGVASRVLSTEEANSFRDYQKQLSLFSHGSTEQLDAPLVPGFCNGLDDSVEVVLSSCYVRNNHVYEGDRLKRPLSNREKQRLATALSRRSRSRRSPGLEKQRDFSALLHRFLNVNSSVTSRFLPVVSQSPLFSMDGALESVLGAGAKETVATAAPTTETTTPSTKATFRPHTKTTRKKYTTKSMYTTPATTSSTESTTKPATFKPIYVQKKSTTRSPSPPTVATVDVPSHFPSSGGEETVKDPILLQLIAQALEKNQLLENLLLSPTLPAQTSVPFHAYPPAEVKKPISLKIVKPQERWHAATVPGPVANVPFSPHLSFTSLGGNESFPNRRRKPANKLPGLPDDICTFQP